MVEKKYKKYHSKDTVHRVFGTWRNALTKAKVIGWTRKFKHTDDDLLEYFEDLWKWREAPPTSGDFEKFNEVSGNNINRSTFTKHFGGYVAFRKNFSDYKLGSITKAELLKRSKKHLRKREDISARLRSRILNKHKYTCQDCGSSPKKDKTVTLHIHHIIPVSKRGPSTEENLTVLCAKCNMGRSDVITD